MSGFHLFPENPDSGILVSNGLGSYVALLVADSIKHISETKFFRIEELIAVETHPDGAVQFHGGWFGSSLVRREQWQRDRSTLENALERAYHHPKIRRDGPYEPREASRGEMGPCLPGEALISTPNELVPIKELKLGDRVWTTDKFGNKLGAVTTRTSKVLVKSNHKMLHIVLNDGRELFVSPGHPDSENSPLGRLVKGKYLAGSRVISAKIVPYKGKYTYDILPAGSTGNYWTNGILIGSTLFEKFKPLKTGNNIATKIAIDMHTYAFFRPKV